MVSAFSSLPEFSQFSQLREAVQDIFTEVVLLLSFPSSSTDGRTLTQVSLLEKGPTFKDSVLHISKGHILFPQRRSCF